METILDIAVRRSGGTIACAEALGVSRFVVYRWKKTGVVPAEHVLALQAVSGISAASLRPDLYGWMMELAP